MDKMREEFELWCRNNPLKTDKDKKGNYKYQSTRLAFMAWQASRKVLVVELPMTVCRTHVYDIPYTSEVGMEHDEYFEVEDIQQALDAAGVSYE